MIKTVTIELTEKEAKLTKECLSDRKDHLNNAININNALGNHNNERVINEFRDTEDACKKVEGAMKKAGL